MTESLNDKLSRLRSLMAQAQPQKKPQQIGGERSGIDGLIRHDFSGGSVLIRDVIHPYDHLYGDFDIHWRVHDLFPADVPPFLAAAAGSTPGSWAFVDCETTGLSGGVGTLAFLVAVGRPGQDGFVIRQFFLREPADECGMLEGIEEFLQGVTTLWTFNGLCFDLPLLETRFRFWRRPFDRESYAHVDLLVPTRVLYRRRITQCTLVSLEERILKMAREEDLPGAEVPSVYFEYLQQGHSPRLHRVLEHNRIDVLSLAVYASYLWRIFDQGTEIRLQYPEDLLSLAQYHYRRREWDRAQQCLEELSSFALGPVLEAECHRLWAYLHKRRGDYMKAQRFFGLLADHPHADPIAALVEQAKFYEHRVKDLPRALEITNRAITLRERELSPVDVEASENGLGALYHRRARLQRRLTRQRRA